LIAAAGIQRELFARFALMAVITAFTLLADFIDIPRFFLFALGHACE